LLIFEHEQAPPILLNAATLRAHFNLPLNDAAKKLGVCATAIKKVMDQLDMCTTVFCFVCPLFCMLS
jgi:hypothetical protein